MDSGEKKETKKEIGTRPDFQIIQSQGKDLNPALFAQVVSLLEAHYPVFDACSAREKEEEIAFFREPNVLQDKLKDETFFLALDTAGNVMGFLNCAEKNGGSFIYWMIVDESLRQLGIARSLHEAYEERFVAALCNQNHTKIEQTLSCDVRNPAFHVYPKLGYKPTHTERNRNKMNFKKQGR